MGAALDELRAHAAALHLELVWNLPVPYSDLNPVALETEGSVLAEGAGKAWLYIEPDGDVLPQQGENRVIGNLLREPWEQIWEKQAVGGI
jgi:MoaA/NifB/PqqE/SkfB family radical SAM enzyme